MTVDLTVNMSMDMTAKSVQSFYSEPETILLSFKSKLNPLAKPFVVSNENILSDWHQIENNNQIHLSN